MTISFSLSRRGGVAQLAKYQFPKPCLGCGVLSRVGSYCDSCLEKKKEDSNYQLRELQRREKKRLLYGGDYKRRRRAVLATATRCAICLIEFTSIDRVEADHIEAGNPLSPLQAVHRRCNLKKSGK